MSSQLPPELWAKICLFLPSSALKRLYTVNSLFFDLSMNERYREFNMEDFAGEPLTTLDFQRFKDPFVARRVRSVVLSPDSLPRSRPSSPKRNHVRSISSKLTLLVSKQKTRKHELSLSPEETAQCLANIFPSMTQVEELIIIWNSASKTNDHHSDQDAALASGYLTCAWQTFARNLHKLAMQISPNKLGDIFPSIETIPSLTRLKHLDMSVEYGTQLGRNLKILLSFLNSVSHTLQSLNITVVADVDLSPLFRDLSHFPQLHSVHLTIAGKLSTPTELYHWLNRHSNELTSFNCFGNFDSPHILPKLTLPYLQCLEIDPRLLLDEWATPAGLHNLKALTNLSLICPLKSSQVTSFLQFCASIDTLSLERLHLCIVELTSNLLELLARSLPRLKYLSLEIIYVVDEKLVSVKPETYFPLKQDMGRRTHSSFAYEMRLRSVLDPFRQWELYDISIRRHPYVCWGIMNVMAECVPSIQSFDGRNHKEMPREALMWMS